MKDGHTVRERTIAADGTIDNIMLLGLEIYFILWVERYGNCTILYCLWSALYIVPAKNKYQRAFETIYHKLKILIMAASG